MQDWTRYDVSIHHQFQSSFSRHIVFTFAVFCAFLFFFFCFCAMNLSMSMNFADAADRSTSTQHEIIALFNGSSQSSTSDRIFHLAGRSFHPVSSQYEVMDGVSTAMDHEWNASMELEPIPWANTQSSHHGVGVVEGSLLNVTSVHKDAHVTDGESSDSSYVSSNFFEEASIDDDLDTPQVSFPDWIRSTTNPQLQHRSLSRQVTDTGPSPVSPSNINTLLADQQQATPECNQSQPVGTTGQDHRFKPFHEEKWNQRYKELVVFHTEHGHVAVPHTYPPNQQLARWIKR